MGAMDAGSCPPPIAVPHGVAFIWAAHMDAHGGADWGVTGEGKGTVGGTVGMGNLGKNGVLGCCGAPAGSWHPSSMAGTLDGSGPSGA